MGTRPVASADDLSPVSTDRRTFSCWDIASLWVGLVVSVPTYYLAGSLVELGMSWWQGVATIVLGNAVLLPALLLIAYIGTRHGLPFPVLARSAFGVRGAHVPALLRALVACGWFGIETWIGGQSLLLLVPESVSSSSPPIPWLGGISLVELGCFLLFWGAQLAVLWRGMAGIRAVGKYASPILVALVAALFAWAVSEAGGLGEMLMPSSPTSLLPPSEFWPLFFPSLTASIGSWSGLAVSIADFSRHAKTQRDQIAGQVGIPLFMGAYTFVGLAVTSATAAVFGAPVADPLKLISLICARADGASPVLGFLIRVVSVGGISLATVTTNVPANIVAPANVLVNMAPSAFSFEQAAAATAVAGLLFQPWRVYGSSGGFVNRWLVGYSMVTGPMSGIMIADYYVVRRMELDVGDLYSSSTTGKYYYWKGFNVVAMVALVVPVAVMAPGFLQEVGMVEGVGGVFVGVYAVSWIFGFVVAGGMYWALSACFWNDGGKGKGGTTVGEEYGEPLLHAGA